MGLKGNSSRSLSLGDVPQYEELLAGLKKAFRDLSKGKYRLKDLALVSTLVFTGCRVGEAARLRWDDILWRQRALKVFQEKKGYEHPRVVPVPVDFYWNLLRKYKKRGGNGERVFPITTRQARNAVYGFTERYLARRLRPHAIRHSYAIYVLKTTRDLEAVRRLLGHSDYKWLKVYLNCTQEDLEERLGEAFEEAFESA
ncbi:MAG: site-specific integrase [Caldisphaeraceae archaeon]|nr:site-specific integrase [Caldisphaeraceae archaeon]MEB3797288.1 site-specific integrase [Caldisphaeraceae archaeon]